MNLSYWNQKFCKSLTKFARKSAWYWLYIWLIGRTCATNISKELLELVIEELINQNVIFNKKIVQGLDSFYKLNEKEVPTQTANSFTEIF